MLVPTTKTGCKFQGQVTPDFTEINGYSQVHALRNLTEQIPSAVASRLTTELTVQKKTRRPFTYQKEKISSILQKKQQFAINTLVLGHFVAKHNGIYAFKAQNQNHHESHNTSKRLHYGQIYTTICLTNHKLLLAMSSNHYSTLLVCFIPQFETSANNIVFVLIWDQPGSRLVSWISLVQDISEFKPRLVWLSLTESQSQSLVLCAFLFHVCCHTTSTVFQMLLHR